MHHPPASGNQQQWNSTPLLDPRQTNVQPIPAPLPAPNLDPLPQLDLLREPELDRGSAFRHSGWAPVRRRVGQAMAIVYPDSERLRRYADCGCGAWVVKHPDHDYEYRVMASYCGDRFCVPCAAMRARTIVANVLPALGERTVRFLTLTLRSESTDELRPLLDKLYRCFALLRRRAWWGRRVMGGVCLLEVKYMANTRRWHPHLHILYHGGFLPKDALSAIWLQITKDSYIIDIRAVQSHGKVAHYLTKYASKPGDYSTLHSVELMTELLLALAGRRLCSTFGSWRCIDLLARPDPVNWIYVDSLEVLHQRAAENDPDAIAILRLIACTPDVDEPSQHDLPDPDG